MPHLYDHLNDHRNTHLKTTLYFFKSEKQINIETTWLIAFKWETRMPMEYFWQPRMAPLNTNLPCQSPPTQSFDSLMIGRMAKQAATID